MDKGNKKRGKPRTAKERPEFDQYIVDLARVTRVTKGGKQLSFRACVLIGDRRGRVGYGLQKGKDVQIAVEKAVNNARKNIIHVPLVKETLPHRVEAKFKAAKVMLKPAPKGSGIIAGSVVRNVLELAGVPNASAKMLGKTNNKIANIKAVFVALQMFKVRHAKPVVRIQEIEKAIEKVEVDESKVAPALKDVAKTVDDPEAVIKTEKVVRKTTKKKISE